MRHFILLVSLVSSLISAASGIVTLDYKVFRQPSGEAYMETHLLFDGTTYQFAVKDNDLFQATAEVTIVITDQQGKIAGFRKINISSPEIENPFGIDFFDLQRFTLAPGSYALEVTILDLNQKNPKASDVNLAVQISEFPSGPSISDILLISGFGKTQTPNDLSRSGFDILPSLLNIYPDESKTINFYSELYGTETYFGAGNPFLLMYSLVDAKTMNTLESTRAFRRKTANAIVPVMEAMDIAEVPAGNYFLRVEIADKEGNVLATVDQPVLRLSAASVEPEPSMADNLREYFYLNQVQDMDSLRNYAASIWPICSNSERNFIDNQIKTSEARVIRNFVYRVFEQRNPENPEAGWVAYQGEVAKVNAGYGTRNLPGYATDRGRVYLQYGPPNSLVERHNDNETLPYEIWHYYSINQFRNRRFVFYSPIAVTTNFELIHSDMWGEVTNPRWNQLVKGRIHEPWLEEGRDFEGERQKSRDKLDEFYVNPR